MKKLILTLFICFSCYSSTEISINPTILDNSNMEFITHHGKVDSYSNVLAMNIEYDQVIRIRYQIERHIGQRLNFLTAWDKNGEAHITTISPVEYKDVLHSHISMARIDEIALENNIQNSDIKILGLGSGKLKIDNNTEETFFIIVDSHNLRKIRQQVYEEFVANGGDKHQFDPTWFFPHITIGYTKRDIHENDGLLKNIKHSLDSRFNLSLD